MSDLPITPREFALRHKLNVFRDTILPAQTQAAILRQCPRVSIGELEDALDTYRFASVVAPPVPARERRAELERVANLSEQLWEALSGLPLTERADLMRTLTRSSGGKPGLTRARVLLTKIATAARNVAEEIHPSAGRPLDRKAFVIRDVARELKRCGYPVDASSKGPLVFIIAELFSLVDDPPQEPRSLVRNSLAKIDLNTMNFRQASPP